MLSDIRFDFMIFTPQICFNFKANGNNQQILIFSDEEEDIEVISEHINVKIVKERLKKGRCTSATSTAKQSPANSKSKPSMSFVFYSSMRTKEQMYQKKANREKLFQDCDKSLDIYNKGAQCHVFLAYGKSVWLTSN